ncbi:hypothetical protein [Aeromicrobium sp. UC242_57]|uniref:hypothetical protein n=1 Tax=Aeromicrobium sp. UC242_57 TaxID=3374624 RepID=UPI0037A91290
MSQSVIPTTTKLAAKHGVVRTATQTPSSVIPITAIAIPTTGDGLLGVGLGVVGALTSALMIIAKGIPGEYVDAAGD